MTDPSLVGVFSESATSPDGTVYLAGTIFNSDTQLLESVVSAWRAQEQAPLWTVRQPGWNPYPGGGHGTVYGMAASADGSTVFITGARDIRYKGGDILNADGFTAAYSSTGELLWQTVHEGVRGRDAVEFSRDVKTSSDPDNVYVLARFATTTGRHAFATLLLDAGTGAVLDAVVEDPQNEDSSPVALAISPNGANVAVTGVVGDDFYSIAYRMAPERTLQRAWARRYSLASLEIPFAIDASNNGFIVIGGRFEDGLDKGSFPFGPPFLYIDLEDLPDRATGVTTSYSWNGKQEWASFFAPYHGPHYNVDVELSPDGKSAYVLAASAGTDGMRPDHVIMGLESTSGAVAWQRRIGRPRAAEQPGRLAVSPDGSRIYASGTQAIEPGTGGFTIYRPQVGNVQQDVYAGAGHRLAHSKMLTSAFDRHGRELWVATMDEVSKDTYWGAGVAATVDGAFAFGARGTAPTGAFYSR